MIFSVDFDAFRRKSFIGIDLSLEKRFQDLVEIGR